MEYKEVKDSGKRESFATGSVRDTREGKGRFDLIPTVPLIRLAKHYENGARKYGDRNWEKGQPLSRYYDSATRHMLAWRDGKTDEDHLTAAIWNLFAILHHEELVGDSLPASLVDMGPLLKDTTPVDKPDVAGLVGPRTAVGAPRTHGFLAVEQCLYCDQPAKYTSTQSYRGRYCNDHKQDGDTPL